MGKQSRARVGVNLGVGATNPQPTPHAPTVMGKTNISMKIKL